MTYNQFISRVKTKLLYRDNPPDPNTNSYIEQSVRDWMSEMQYFVDNYRQNNEQTYKEPAFTVSCKGGVVDLPDDIEVLKSVFFIRPREVTDLDGCEDAKRMEPVSWEDRDKLFSGEWRWKYAVHPRMENIVVSPYPEDDEDGDADKDQFLRIEWEGVKTEYDGDDQVPFGTDSVQCCSHFVNAELSRLKEDKSSRHNSFMNSYRETRLRLNAKENQRG